jgi:endonuclease V-like protein UPF0215 family
MKAQIKLLGIDDGAFHFNDKMTSIIGVVMRANGYIEGILKREVTIDGDDSTSVLIDMIINTSHRKQLKALLLDGLAVGGFNIINIKTIFQETQLPVLTVTRDPPNFVDIKKALQSHFFDWQHRYNLIKEGHLHSMKTKHNPIYFQFIGMDVEQAKEIITISTIRGVIPEPIRVAHLIASGITRGELVGKA